MTQPRSLAAHAVEQCLILKAMKLYSVRFTAGYLNALEVRQNQEAVEAAEAICQERMMNGVYGNDAAAMARDLESETELQKMLRKKQ